MSELWERMSDKQRLAAVIMGWLLCYVAICAALGAVILFWILPAVATVIREVVGACQ